MFQKFSGSEKFKDKRGGISRFSVEKFLSHSAKSFAGETFCAVFQKNSGSDKVFGYESVDIKIFRVFFCLTVRRSSFRRGILKCFINFRY